jgi:hypothetical protein
MAAQAKADHAHSVYLLLSSGRMMPPFSAENWVYSFVDRNETVFRNVVHELDHKRALSEEEWERCAALYGEMTGRDFFLDSPWSAAKRFRLNAATC